MGDEIERVTASSDAVPPEWLSDTPDGDPERFSLVRAIAEDEDTGLIELRPGVWWQPKFRGEMPSDRKLS